MFNAGIVEAAQGCLISNYDQFKEPADRFFWPSTGNFRYLSAYIDSLVSFIGAKGVNAPYAGIITVGRCRGAFLSTNMHSDRPTSDWQTGRILTDRITYGPVMLDETGQGRSRSVLVDGIMDRVWQAAGKINRPSIGQ